VKPSFALIAICAVLPVASVAGCGGSSSGNSTIPGEGTGPPKERPGSSYIEGSAALCRSLTKRAAPIHEEWAELQGSIRGKAQEAKAISVLKEYVALGREEEIDLRELGTPPGDAGIVSRWTAVAREGLDRLEEAIEALEEGEDSKFEVRSNEGSKLLYEGRRIARDHGFIVCGEQGGGPI
jgi:hypothetical protein